MWVKIDLKYFKINDALQVYSHLSRWCKRRKKNWMLRSKSVIKIKH